MQPLKNTSQLADIALRNYYEAQSSSSKSISTYNESDDAPFYKDISPRRASKPRQEVDPEEAREMYANTILANYKSSENTISISYRKVLQVQRELNQTSNLILSNVKTYNDALDNLNQTASKIYQREEAEESRRSKSVRRGLGKNE